MGSLRAFPRPARDTPEGLSAKKPNWRRLCLDEAKKGHRANMLTSILAILSFADPVFLFSASPFMGSDSGFLVCTAAVLLCLSGSPSRYAYMR